MSGNIAERARLLLRNSAVPCLLLPPNGDNNLWAKLVRLRRGARDTRSAERRRPQQSNDDDKNEVHRVVWRGRRSHVWKVLKGWEGPLVRRA